MRFYNRNIPESVQTIPTHSLPGGSCGVATAALVFHLNHLWKLTTLHEFTKRRRLRLDKSQVSINLLSERRFQGLRGDPLNFSLFSGTRGWFVGSQLSESGRDHFVYLIRNFGRVVESIRSLPLLLIQEDSQSTADDHLDQAEIWPREFIAPQRDKLWRYQRRKVISWPKRRRRILVYFHLWRWVHKNPGHTMRPIPKSTRVRFQLFCHNNLYRRGFRACRGNFAFQTIDFVGDRER